MCCATWHHLWSHVQLHCHQQHPLETLADHFVQTWPLTHFYNNANDPVIIFKDFWHQYHTTIEASLSKPTLFRMPYTVLAKRLLQLGLQTPTMMPKARWISTLSPCWPTTRNRSCLQTGSRLSLSPYSNASPRLYCSPQLLATLLSQS